MNLKYTFKEKLFENYRYFKILKLRLPKEQKAQVSEPPEVGHATIEAD